MIAEYEYIHQECERYIGWELAESFSYYHMASDYVGVIHVEIHGVQK